MKWLECAWSNITKTLWEKNIKKQVCIGGIRCKPMRESWNNFLSTPYSWISWTAELQDKTFLLFKSPNLLYLFMVMLVTIATGANTLHVWLNRQWKYYSPSSGQARREGRTCIRFRSWLHHLGWMSDAKLVEMGSGSGLWVMGRSTCD